MTGRQADTIQTGRKADKFSICMSVYLYACESHTSLYSSETGMRTLLFFLFLPDQKYSSCTGKLRNFPQNAYGAL